MTNPTQNGQNKSSIEERATRLEEDLIGLERSLGIPALAGEDEVTGETRKILSLPPSELRKMSAVQAGEAAFVMGQYSHRLQQVVNRELSKAIWAAENIKKIIAPRVGGYKGVSFEERRLAAVYDNEAAAKLETIRVQCQIKAERLSFLSTKADNLAKTLQSIAASKRGHAHE